jgi:AraC-like DNA-binding protein
MFTPFWPVDALFGEVVYPPGSTYGPRTQIYLQLVLLHSGSMTVWIDGRPRSALAGTVALLFPGHEERFAFASAEVTHHSWLHMLVEPLDFALAQRLAALPWPLPLSTTMSELVALGLRLRSNSAPAIEELRKSLACAMLWHYIGEGEALLHGTSMRQEHPALEQARRYIEQHLAEPLSLQAIAAAAAISPPQLTRLFRGQLDITPMAYVWERRLAYGLQLLRDTGLPIGVIAARCGFQTSYHFSRRIREATGLAPSLVRQRAWQRVENRE